MRDPCAVVRSAAVRTEFIGRQKVKEAVQSEGRPIKHSVREGEVIYPILLPALFVVLVAEWLFFTVADRLETISRNALLEKSLLHGFGPTRSESEAVLDRSAVIAMPSSREVRRVSVTWIGGGSAASS